MAARASKRRKTEHHSSEEEDGDSASFASFGDSEEHSAEQETEDLDEEEDAFEEEVSEDDLEETILNENASDGPNGNGALPDVDSQVKSNGNGFAATKAPNAAGPDHSSQNQAVKTFPKGSTYTSGTFKSNMFKLQVDDLLEHTRARHGKRESEAESALHKLKTAIERIPTRSPVLVDDAERQLLLSSKVATPFPHPRPPKDAKYKLEYAKPANINVVGSYALKTQSRAKSSCKIDMVVRMPSSLFQDKDYLNYRYFYKRAYYLACIAAGIQDEIENEYHISVESSHDDLLKPILVVRPDGQQSRDGERKAVSKWQINILPCISEDVFQLAKILPSKSCVRPRNNQAIDKNSEQAERPTPFYNSSLRSDMLMTSYLTMLNSTSKTCEAFKDVCLLGSTWLRQRGFGSNIHAGGFGNFEWSALMATLLRGGGSAGKPLLSEGYSSYQLFKATLQLLAMKNLAKQPLIVGSSHEVIESLPSGVPVVWDGTQSHNLLYKMSPWSYKALRQEARNTLSTLGHQSFDGFESAFILRTDNPLYRYDFVVELDAVSLDSTNSQGGYSSLEAQQNLYEVLQRGLGDRVSQINLLPQWLDSWEIGSSGPARASRRTLRVGFSVNPEVVNRTVDHGPSAEDKAQTASFRKFWGEKAELRRFKDGSIVECLVWSGKENETSVLEQIVRYLISSHFGGHASEGLTIFGDAFKSLLLQGNETSASQRLMEAYKTLETDIRSLDNLPLSIRQIMPADAQLRYSSTSAAGDARRRKPANVVIQFEGSARWPDDLVAIQRTKIAFLLKLRDLLQDAVDSVVARIGLENEEHNSLNQAFLDIVYSSGVSFRLRILHDREQTLLERKLKDKTLDPRSKEIAALGSAKYKRDYIKSPAHTQAIARLCSRHPAMSGTIKLLKKWFASHLLSNHVPDEVIELLVARTFVQPWPWQTPSSVQTGFFRTLSWISRWDWRAEPLIVDLSEAGEMKLPDVQAINTKFEAWRKLDPALNRVVVFAASNVDPDGTTWTDGCCFKVVMGRMSALAKAAIAEVEEKQLLLDPPSLFSSPLIDFDFALHIKPELIGKEHKRKGKKGATFKNLEIESGDTYAVDVVQNFLNEVGVVFGSSMLLFSGGHELPALAGLWNPQMVPRTWRLSLDYSTTPRKVSGQEEVQATINEDAILRELASLGEGMIQRVDVHS